MTAREKHDGQKQMTKARLVARRFQDPMKPQSDSPTVSKESFKMLMAIAANEDLMLALVDIRAALIQSRTLDRDVFMLPPSDIHKPGVIWQLKKPHYVLDDTSRKFGLWAKEVLKTIGLKVMAGDEAFYYLHKDGKLMGAVITHVDDFTLAGTNEFVDQVLKVINEELTVSKVEEDVFRYTGIEVKKIEDRIVIQMKDYIESLEEVKEIRKADREDDLTKAE